MVTTHRSVLTRTVSPSADHASFVGAEGDGTVAPDAYALDIETWREMGEPDTITVVVEPGDTLNG